MLRVRSYDLARDESGAGTIMGLLWFMLGTKPVSMSVVKPASVELMFTASEATPPLKIA